RIDVGDARHDDVLAVGEGAALGVGEHQLEGRDRQPLADAGALVDLAIGARLKRDLLDYLPDVVRDLDLQRAGAFGPRFLPGDGHRVAARRRVVGADFRA